MKQSKKYGAAKQWSLFYVMFSIICVSIAFLPPSNANALQEAKEEIGVEGTGSSDLIQSLCNKTSYFDVCNSSLSSYPGADGAFEWEFGRIAVEVSLNEAQSVYDYTVDLNTTDAATGAAIEDCVELLDDTMGALHDCLPVLTERNWTQSGSAVNDVNIRLSAALTFQDTCVEGFIDEGAEMPHDMKDKVDYLQELTSNALAIVTYLSVTETQKLIQVF